MTPRAFYSVADAAHFPGVAALINSLRVLGHDEPIFLVDAGLTPQQRLRLAPHVTGERDSGRGTSGV